MKVVWPKTREFLLLFWGIEAERLHRGAISCCCSSTVVRTMWNMKKGLCTMVGSTL